MLRTTHEHVVFLFTNTDVPFDPGSEEDIKARKAAAEAAAAADGESDTVVSK